MKLKSLKVAGIALATLIVGLLAGCGGGGGGQSNEQQIRDRYYSFWKNVGSGNVSTAMSYVSPEYYDGVYHYADLRAALYQAPLFTVKNYEVSDYTFDTDKQWAVITASLDLYYNGGGVDHLSGYEYFHKRSGQWYLCGYYGRAEGGKNDDHLLEKLLKKIPSSK